MSSREEILNNLKKAKGIEEVALPNTAFDTSYLGDIEEQFKSILVDILHTEVIEIESLDEIRQHLPYKYAEKRIVTYLEEEWKNQEPNKLQDVEFALFEGTLGVAENGAIWLSESQMGQRIAPFICQRMGVVLKKSDIVPTLQQAYEKLEINDSGFGVFVSGPSKTADIEQSLVIGAHGPRELVVFLI